DDVHGFTLTQDDANASRLCRRRAALSVTTMKQITSSYRRRSLGGPCRPRQRLWLGPQPWPRNIGSGPTAPPKRTASPDEHRLGGTRWRLRSGLLCASLEKADKDGAAMATAARMLDLTPPIGSQCLLP